MLVSLQTLTQDKTTCETLHMSSVVPDGRPNHLVTIQSGAFKGWNYPRRACMSLTTSTSTRGSQRLSRSGSGVIPWERAQRRLERVSQSSA